MKQKKRYFLFTYEDWYDDAFGGGYAFESEIALSSDSYLYASYNKNCLSKIEMSKEDYDEYNKFYCGEEEEEEDEE